MKPRMTSACTHQFTRAARTVVQAKVEQERHHQRDDEAADEHRLPRHVVAERRRAARTRAGSAGP